MFNPPPTATTMNRKNLLGMARRYDEISKILKDNGLKDLSDDATVKAKRLRNRARQELTPIERRGSRRTMTEDLPAYEDDPKFKDNPEYQNQFFDDMTRYGAAVERTAFPNRPKGCLSWFLSFFFWGS